MGRLRLAVRVAAWLVLASCAMAVRLPLNSGGDDDNCYVTKFTRGVQKKLPAPAAPAPFGEFLLNGITHVAVITRTDAEAATQLAAFKSVGIGPWTDTPLSLNLPATYCGKPVVLNATVWLTTNVFAPGNTATYYEVFKLVGDAKTFFSDYYDVHGPSLLYYGSVAVPGKTRQQVNQFLQQQNVPIVFTFQEEGLAIADWIRIGFVYAEVVYLE